MELAQYLYSQITSGQLDEVEGRRYIAEVLPADIAVVGMSCEYTGASTVFELEEMLRSGRNGFKAFPESRRRYFPRDHRYLVDASRMVERDSEELFQQMCDQLGAYLDDVGMFEPGFFDIPEKEATYIDPMHRLVLKHLHLAIEHSGMTREEIYGSRTAIYVGKDRSIAGSYASEIEADSDLVNPGTWEGILASRLNYLYDLQGGSLVVDTACSSSLVALHLAKKMLHDNEIDIALVGGIALGLAPRQGEVFGDYASVETKRDFLAVFDQASSGTIFGEGVGFVMLRRLPDALDRGDHVYSVVRATGINSDGRSNGLTAPNPKAQTNLIRDTYRAASISPETIDYIDAHGTGTKLGDPIEIRGLTDAFRGDGVTSYSRCALSSLKENIGHTVGAAGVGGLIKMSLALDSQLIFPASGFTVPNDFIKFIDTPFYVPDTLAHWERGDHPRRGAISGFGFSGTNGHAVLEEFAGAERDLPVGAELPFVVSAPTPHQLGSVIDGFLAHEGLVREKELADIAYTLVRRRRRYAAAAGFTATSHDELFARLRAARAAIGAAGADPAEGIVAVGLDGSGTGGSGSAGGSGQAGGSRAVQLLRTRVLESPELFGVADRLEIELTEGGGFFHDRDFPQSRVCGLPGHVFDTKEYWGTVKTYNVYQPTATETATAKTLTGEPVSGQLLDTRIVSTPTVDLYSMRLDLTRWFLTDHQIAGRPTLSGTAYTQLAAEIATLHFGSPAYELTKMMFQNLIQVDEPRTVLVEVARQRDASLRVEVFSQGDDAGTPFVTHGSFTVRPLDHSAVDRGPGSVPTTVQAEAFAWKSDEEDSSGMRFSGRWDLRRNVMVHDVLDPSDHLVHFELHEDYLADLTDFHISPAMLDLVAGIVSWERSTATGRAFLPLSYGRLHYTGRPFTRSVSSRTRLRYDVDSNPLVAVADVWVYDEDGELIIALERYAMRAFSGAGREVSYHDIVLEPLAWPQGDDESLPGSVLVVGPAADAERGLAALRPHWGDSVRWVDSDDLGGSGGADGSGSLDAMTDKVDLALHVLPRVTPGDDAALVRALEQQLVVSRSLPRRLTAGGRLVTLAAAGLAPAGDAVDPFAYAALAASRVVQMESPRITTVGISDESLDLARAVRLGWADELAGRKVHVSGDTLLGEALRPHGATLPARSIEPGETVLVTGAFGGIGTEYLSALWRDYQADVVVLGRTSLEQLEQSDAGDDRERAARIRALEAQGLSVRFIQCDLADTSAVRSAVAALQASGTRVGGVVHLAGAPEDGMLFRKDWASLHQVVAPKALAAAALVDALGDEPEFFIAASSMTTIVGAPGQFGYTFANAYLEGLARAGTGVSTVRWPGWSETGMATRFGVADAADDSFLLRALPTAEGGEYVRRSIAGRYTDLVVGELTAAAGPMLTPWLTVDVPAAQAATATPSDSSGPTGPSAPASTATGAASSAAAPAAPSAATSAAVDGAADAGFAIKDWASLTVTGTTRELDDLEKFITVLFASVLDISEIDVRASFTDLGGDSLKAFSIYTPLVDHFQVDLEVADIFIHGAVLELSEHVRSLQGA